jgi:tetratricopeptide (TPR) repeat protein
MVTFAMTSSGSVRRCASGSVLLACRCSIRSRSGSDRPPVLMRLALCAVVVGVPSAVFAQPADPEGGQAAFRVGAQAFRANRFDVAARAFEQAYERDPQPETAFSTAQANRLQYYLDRIGWRVQRAVQLYQAYLEKLPAGPRAKDALDRLGELEPVLRELRQRGEIAPYIAPIRTELVVGAEVEQARVTIDGRTVALWEPTAVAPGAHDIIVEAAGFDVERRRVVIAEGRFLPIDIALRAKPGRLAVRSEPGATLYVDGRRIGALPRDPTRVVAGSHFLSVTRRGREAWNREVEIARDRDVVVDADLVPTGQRRAARWVLIGGATVAATAVGVGLWAYAAHRDARALDDKRRALSATPEDLRAYLERVEDVQFRTNLATGFGLTALALGVIGAGMIWFDSPRPGAPPKSVEPVVGDGVLGVSVRAGF